MDETLCVVCSSTFVPNRKGHVCCSKACSFQHWYDKNRDIEKARVYNNFLQRRNPLKQGICESCGNPFETPYHRQRTCSKACWWKLHYKENTARQKAKAFRVRQKRLLDYQERERRKWSEIRENRGTSDAYAKTKYPWLPLFTGARHRCLKNNLPFELTKEWCEQHWTGKCKLTDIPFDLTTPGRNNFAPSIDRIEASKGYVPANCRFVLWAVNALKFTGTDADMYRIARALVEKQNIQILP